MVLRALVAKWLNFAFYLLMSVLQKNETQNTKSVESVLEWQIDAYGGFARCDATQILVAAAPAVAFGHGRHRSTDDSEMRQKQSH